MIILKGFCLLLTHASSDMRKSDECWKKITLLLPEKDIFNNTSTWSKNGGSNAKSGLSNTYFWL